MNLPALAAWRKRNRPELRDALWRAACWEAAAAETRARFPQSSRVRDLLAKAAAIVEEDELAVLAVMDAEPRRRRAPATRHGAPSADRPPEPWPRARRGAWA